MTKKIAKTKTWNFENKTLLILSLAFIGVMASAWIYSVNLQNTLNSQSGGPSVDVKALTEVEKLRNVAESQISNSLSFFLLGSSTLFDEQKKNKRDFMEALTAFEKTYSLSKVPEIMRRIEALQQQQQEIFDQAMEFRAKQTESKIVGQFYRSKTASIREQINKALDEIVELHNAEFDRARESGIAAAADAQVRIPKAMSWFTGLISFLFLGMVFLVVRMLRERTRQLAERTRLYEEAQKAVLSRDEVLAAISQDLKEPLCTINLAAEGMKSSVDPAIIKEGAEVIKSSAAAIEGVAQDIVDISKADNGNMILRLEQLGVDSILEEAKMMLQPIAKKKDVRLEFNSVNPPVLAFMDRERVIRVLSNLIGNAIKFSPKNNKVIVKVRSDQQFIFISVKDSGPGIPEKQLSGIFDEFWQANKTADQGSGVGLAVAKTVVEAHGGTVSVESHAGHGSTFTFSLPRRRPAGANLGKPMSSTIKAVVRPPVGSDQFL